MRGKNLDIKAAAVFVTCIILFCLPVHARAVEGPPVLTAWDNGFLAQTEASLAYIDTEGGTRDIRFEDPESLTMLKTVDAKLFLGYEDGRIIRSDAEGQRVEIWRDDSSPIDIAQTDDAFFIATTEKIIVMDADNGTDEYFMKSPVIGIAATKYAAVAAAQDGALLVQQDNGTFVENAIPHDMTVTDIRAVNDVIYVTGYNREDRPILLYTLAGGVWSERKLVMTQDTSAYEELDAIPLDIDYSDALEALVLSCTDGYIAVLPSCVKCNAFYRIGEGDLTDIAVNGEYIGVLEDSGALRIIESSQIPTRDNPAGDCNGGC